MNADDLPLSRADGDDELLSAYLDGELPAEQAAALEARLEEDPALAGRLDAVADTLVALRRLEAVPPPAGFAARLADRLDTPLETSAEASDAAGAGEAGAEPRVDQLGQRRARREARTGTDRPWMTRAWAAWGGVAAALVAVAVISAGGLGQGGLGGAEEESAAVAPRAQSDTGADGGGEAAAMRAPATAAVPEAAEQGAGAEGLSEHPAESADKGTEAAGGPDHTGPAEGRAAAVLPLLVDAGLSVADTDELAAAYADLPEADAVLGTPRTEADALGEGAAESIRRAEVFPSSGLSPAACLDAALDGTGQPAVPVRVEALHYAGEPALAYVVVLATPGAPGLDEVRALVLSPPACTTPAQTPVPMGPAGR